MARMGSFGAAEVSYMAATGAEAADRSLLEGLRQASAPKTRGHETPVRCCFFLPGFLRREFPFKVNCQKIAKCACLSSSGHCTEIIQGICSISTWVRLFKKGPHKIDAFLLASL